MKPNETSQIVIGDAMKVHTALGPGVLESAYDACLFYLNFNVAHMRDGIYRVINGPENEL